MLQPSLETTVKAPALVAEGRLHWSLPDVVRELAGEGGVDIIVELIEVFLADSLSRLAEVQRALAIEDRRAIGAAVHSMKGSALQIGAGPMASICLEIERDVSQLSVRELGQRVGELQGEFKAVCDALKAHLASM